MKPSKQNNNDSKSSSSSEGNSESQGFTKLTEELLSGRQVSKTELGQRKKVGRKSVVLVP